MSILVKHRANTVGLVKKAVALGYGIEFDVTVMKGRLIAGHPTELRKGGRRVKATDFASKLMRACAKKPPMVIVDVKASIWNNEKERAEFGPGELDVLQDKLPELIRTLREAGWHAVLFCGQTEFFETMDLGVHRDIPAVFL